MTSIESNDHFGEAARRFWNIGPVLRDLFVEDICRFNCVVTCRTGKIWLRGWLNHPYFIWITDEEILHHQLKHEIPWKVGCFPYQQVDRISGNNANYMFLTDSFFLLISASLPKENLPWLRHPKTFKWNARRREDMGAPHEDVKCMKCCKRETASDR